MKPKMIIEFFFLILIAYSCKKENLLNEPHLRIAKIASNHAMESPTTFEYDSKGLLTRINCTNNDGPEYFTIHYNGDQKPVTIYDSIYYYNSLESADMYTVDWTSNSFAITSQTGDRYTTGTITFNSQNQITNESDGSSTVVNTWIGNSKVIRTFTYALDPGNNYTDTLKFNTINSPFSRINIALIKLIDSKFNKWDECQTKYCASSWEIGSNFSYTMTYDLNAQNLPIRQDTKNNLNEHTYLYFEYESY